MALTAVLLSAPPSDAFWCCRHKGVGPAQTPSGKVTAVPTAGVFVPPISTDILSCTGTEYVPGACVDMLWARVDESESTGCIHKSLIGLRCDDPRRIENAKRRVAGMAGHKWLYPAIRLASGEFRRAKHTDAFWHAFLPRGHFDPMPDDPD